MHPHKTRERTEYALDTPERFDEFEPKIQKVAQQRILSGNTGRQQQQDREKFKIYILTLREFILNGIEFKSMMIRVKF